MSEEKLRTELSTLERKVRLLISEHRKMRSEIISIKAENDALRSKINSKDGELSNFQNKFKISKLVGNMTVGKEDTKELKNVLDGYIQEIDKCIAQLSEA